MARTPASPSTNDDASKTPSSDDASATPAVGKGRPTPTRAEREAARRRPLVANTKEARAAARAELRERRARAEAGLAAGDEKFLPPRDKGPQRRWVRDYVDAGWHPAEFLMGIMVLVIIASLIPANVIVSYYAYLFLIAYLVIAIGGMILLGRRVKRKVAARFGAERMERGLGWYAAMRSMQMRFMRLPKPQVKRGQYPA